MNDFGRKSSQAIGELSGTVGLNAKAAATQASKYRVSGGGRIPGQFVDGCDRRQVCAEVPGNGRTAQANGAEIGRDGGVVRW